MSGTTRILAVGLLALSASASQATADPILIVSATSGPGGSVEANSLGLAGAVQVAGRAYSGTEAEQQLDGADAAVFEGLLSACDFGCDPQPGFGRSKAEVDPLAGTLRAFAFSASNNTGASATAGLSDTLTFSPRAGFGTDVYIEFDIDLAVHANGLVEDTGSALGAFFFGNASDVEDWRFLMPGTVEGYFTNQKSQYVGLDAECFAAGLGEDESCHLDGRYTVVLPGLADGVPRDYFFLLTVLAGCGSNDCEALADAANTVHTRILNPYVSASGYHYDGATGEPDPDPDPIPEPATLTLIGVAAGGLRARARRRARP